MAVSKRSSGAIAGVTAAVLVLLSAGTICAGGDEPDFASRHPSQKVLDRDFALKSGGRLRVDLDDIDVYIKGVSGGKAHVDFYVAGPDADKAKEYFEDVLRLDVELEGDELEIVSNQPAMDGRFWRPYRNVHAWAIVSVPAKINASVSVGDGDVRIDALDGVIEVDSKDGDVELRDLRGDTIDVRTSDGDIVARSLDAGTVMVRADDGDIKADLLRGKRITVTSEDGDIDVERIEGGRVDIRTSDGTVEVGVAGEELSIECDDGTIDVELFTELKADLWAEDGDIEVRIPEALSLDLELKGDRVRVRGADRIKGDISSRRVNGELNKGGPLLRARASDGSIALEIR